MCEGCVKGRKGVSRERCVKRVYVCQGYQECIKSKGVSRVSRVYQG